MGSKGRLPPPHHLRRPLPGPGMGHHDPIPPEMHPHHGGFPPYDMHMPPPPEIMEQKIAAQHVEMQKLATENRRFAATHGTLRQDLATIQHELQMLHNHVGAIKSEREQQIMGLLDRIGKMEADLQGAEPIKMELNKARADAQSLLAARDELVSRVHQLTEDNQRAHMELQQVPALMSELESLRQEYQHCRQTYDYEKKIYNEHLESLQVMEKNYMTMASEVEKLRAELKKQAEIDRRTAAGPYAGYAGHNDKEASGHYPVGPNAYEDSYAAPQGRAPLPVGGGAADGHTAVGSQSGPTALRAGYDVYRGPGPAVPGYDPQRGSGFHKGPAALAYDPQRGPGAPAYDPQRGPGAPAYDPQRGPGAPAYDPQRGPGAPAYDPQRGPGAPAYDPHRGPNPPSYDLYRGPGGTGYDRQRGPGGPARGPQYGGPGYEAHRGTSFESPSGPSGPQGQANNTTYGSVAATAHAGGVYQGAQVHPPADGNHPGRR
ncbi:hypothetical protein HanRHA438_Chr07g0318551 [Helianthus annuus]|uniref:Protein FLX-like 2 n=1 Tax=Helianthus annuus TaxID=4232 RepID=A0A9K3IP39_HELAN|nr:protein FLX-like 2 isoform X2 [Helianthus annuus]KAF5799870.1 hypothetical protein HanXRQr2_Chr07g0309461 [Helianthus annuus]KAJ0551266.1 hypothetical protein HanHA300_Chr07g0255191 [Helianthus annuus]KAJ0564233.1 hypothetical protein HanHA89_Chr07g0271981 [Helianthus annuus]KAJ0909166.1 hypothetical protein HanRHA438_Chr07g0318551 [Helianthus annuus]